MLIPLPQKSQYGLYMMKHKKNSVIKIKAMNVISQPNINHKTSKLQN